MTQVLPNREQIPKKGCYPHGLAWRMVYNHTYRQTDRQTDRQTEAGYHGWTRCSQTLRHGTAISGGCRRLNQPAQGPACFCSQCLADNHGDDQGVQVEYASPPCSRKLNMLD
ncbi:hypothetical protein SAMN05421881_103324 [Nitrosomonas halophila]|uniref:Uncharacterized protein n=1 Tax=Nitrosomonas halophila TaxID=44576 RepID=A0A1H3JIK7_9PROT|nr:hypothetical protein SAMN05421881_103324 [Nitrosomonas halophila]